MLENGSVIQTYHLNSFKEVNAMFPQLTYHQIRSIYKQSYQPRQRQHATNKKLTSKMRITEYVLEI